MSVAPSERARERERESERPVELAMAHVAPDCSVNGISTMMDRYLLPFDRMEWAAIANSLDD